MTELLCYPWNLSSDPRESTRSKQNARTCLPQTTSWNTIWTAYIKPIQWPSLTSIYSLLEFRRMSPRSSIFSTHQPPPSMLVHPSLSVHRPFIPTTPTHICPLSFQHPKPTFSRPPSHVSLALTRLAAALRPTSGNAPLPPVSRRWGWEDAPSGILSCGVSLRHRMNEAQMGTGRWGWSRQSHTHTSNSGQHASWCRWPIVKPWSRNSSPWRRGDLERPRGCLGLFFKGLIYQI
jgi:hypothetical protein